MDEDDKDKDENDEDADNALYQSGMDTPMNTDAIPMKTGKN